MNLEYHQRCIILTNNPHNNNDYYLGGLAMEDIQNFEHILERFKAANVEQKIEIYTSVRGLSTEQYKELLKYFPIKELGKLEQAMG